MNIAFIPIDNRPVCYTLPEQICAIDENIKLFMPERKFLGSLTKYADVNEIFSWLENLPELDAIVMCLDTVAYGGLISSRRCPDSFEQIKSRVEKLKSILEKKNAKIYAFSSIMRISNNNVNEEEKEYWNKWGKKIFDYSYQTHKLGTESCITNIIPSEILDDYLATRKRNFEINKLYLEYQKQGLFDTLVFSKDDCAEYGFNVQEAQILEKLGGFVKTGADEIPLTLLARAVVKTAGQDLEAKTQRCEEAKFITDLDARQSSSLQGRESSRSSETSYGYERGDDNNYEKEISLSRTSNAHECSQRTATSSLGEVNFATHQNNFSETDQSFSHLCIFASKIKIAPIFLAPDYKDLISNYEDVSIEKSVKGQIELAGCKVCKLEDADILLYVNNFEERQGEIVMKVPTRPFSGKWKKPEKPYMIADVRYANGSDNAFVNQLFDVGLDENFLGYSAWNTSANSLGSLICGAIVFLEAKRQRCEDAWSVSEASNFKKLQVIRFLDDWGYQANVRQQLTSPDEKLVKELMKPYEEKVFELLGVRYNISYKFPWNRLFEVEICI